MPKKKAKTTTTKKAQSASRRTTKATKAKPKKTVVKKAAKKVVSKKVEAKKPEATKKPTPPKPVEFDSLLVKKYQEHKGDTGSTGVQIALLSDRMQELVKHLKKHAKDFDSKRGLLILVGKRRRLLNYLAKTKPKQYETMIVDLKLRK